MNNVTDFIFKTWTSTRKTKVSPKGWHSGNAPCCVHNGETKDTRGRGGVKIDNTGSGGIVYSCFNCGFKTGYKPGQKLYHKTRKLLRWMGANESDIQRMVIESLRVRETQIFVEPEEKEFEEINFKRRPLPKEALSFEEWVTWCELNDSEYPAYLIDAADMAAERFGENVPDLYWTPNKEKTMNKRLIIPFTWKGKIVGYTARRLFDNSSIPKYLMEVDSDYVYGTDNLIKESNFVLVFEGPIDAILMNGVAVLSNQISEEQADLIESLGKDVIVVPDLNHTGLPLINSAIDYGWSVSFPEWDPEVKDAGEAFQKYGKLFTLKSIINNVQTSKLKIELQKRKINE